MKDVILNSLVVIFLTLVIVFFYANANSKNKEKNPIVKSKKSNSLTEKRRLTILYATQTGTSRSFAIILRDKILSKRYFLSSNVRICDLKEYNHEDEIESEDYLLLIIPTWTGGTHVKDAQIFADWVHEASVDFRYGKTFLSKQSIGVFGLGNAEYDDNFCLASKLLHTDLETLGAKVILPVGLGDDNEDMLFPFNQWIEELLLNLKPEASIIKKSNKIPLKEYRRMKKEAEVGGTEKEEEYEEDKINEALLIEADKDYVKNFDADRSDKTSTLRAEAVMEGENLVDLEDLGKVMKSSVEYTAKANDGVIRDMVTPAQRRALVKEGYKIIGTHSAVKLCRWTKNQLRGRGGCYKHTFYGITSYQCMEATPSLACANKCVFCWRHHKNPVGREWRWTTDDPELIITEAISKHQDMINQAKGVPGVIPERWSQAFNVRHCALSLVGEPIMYPHINKFLRLLHERNISSFLVTNAQFPEAIINLEPCCQLYVSVDGGTKESLKAVDRPLFTDFWERYIACLKALNEKQQRTVYRMTLVKSWNMEEAANYCKLVRLGEPDFIEIKAVTYCGKSDGSNLTMENVPWHEEVRNYAIHLCEALGGDYGIATEHRHSCCMLLAKKKTFLINGQWHTWIDYDKFNALIKEFYETGKTFTSEDYIAPTPYWAVYGAEEQGFSPFETRWYRKQGDGASVCADQQEYDDDANAGCG